MEREDSARLTREEGRSFGLTVGGAFLALAGVFWWHQQEIALGIAAVLGGALVLAGLLLPTRLGPVRRRWMALAEAISRVTTPILMGAVYYLVVTPSGLLMRLLGRDPLERRGSGQTYWVERANEASPSDMKRKF